LALLGRELYADEGEVVQASLADAFFFLHPVLLNTVFTAGYALFHVPGGWLGDTVGPRRMLTLAILWWSMLRVDSYCWGLVVAGLLGPWVRLWSSAFLIGIGEERRIRTRRVR